jgi:hypothetical protein
MQSTLKTRSVNVSGQDFNISSLNVRQFADLMDARKQLYGEAATAAEIMAKNVPSMDMLTLEAKYIVAVSLNNAAKGNGSQEPPITGEEVLDALDHDTFRGLVSEIMGFIGLKVEQKGPQAVAKSGESQAAAS